MRTGTGIFDTERGFTGQIRDTSTGLNFYNARYQDPVLGRFISPDSIVPDPFSATVFNRFAYVKNSPLIYTDPTGNCPWCRKAGDWVKGQLDRRVVRPVAEAIRPEEGTVFHGVDFTLIVVAFSVSAEIGVAVDAAGNYGVQSSAGGLGGLGFGASVGAEREVTSAHTIDSLNGPGIELGGRRGRFRQSLSLEDLRNSQVRVRLSRPRSVGVQEFS